MSQPPTGMPFADLMGVQILERARDKVVGQLQVREDLCTAGGILHGGAFMAFADALGAIGGFLNLPAGTRTTTLESKTNFLGSAKVGTTVTGEAIPLHIGRRSSVWQTRITAEDGKLLALVLQTQMTVELGPAPKS
ncbi:MAG: PaaI family thioesterase [Phenylobacterium sp.]|uniref:PaaI family thioesterase n=1 Tax=Phenylobacterium sp. TaxID=1871053 RepID=UPI0025E69809|nr:PaaI family thioesterase [Phenylobacterium sp.]MCG9915626.1 PaaI family thioesterase [Phenylobacterium sp.]